LKTGFKLYFIITSVFAKRNDTVCIISLLYISKKSTILFKLFPQKRVVVARIRY